MTNKLYFHDLILYTSFWVVPLKVKFITELSVLISLSCNVLVYCLGADITFSRGSSDD